MGEDVVANAVLAATRDPRFAPVEPEELGSLSLEVSVLTEPEPLEAADEAEVVARLRPGVDGVVLQMGPHRTTFLPQVWEELDDPLVFLVRLKRKAGLAEDFWHEELVVPTYRVRCWSRP
ncbi:MAG: AmmeMemoRadiSam system protein A [Actinomyces sp.]|nr:AmmeMemoRadiSam system protein A [Actinomyces sp.]MDO4243297.1 AmmeMemoRadiSam system protein A [Actinomyces sp.]